MKRATWWSALAIAVFAVVAPVASAATVSVAAVSEYGEHNLRYDAGAGERNDVLFEFLPGRGIHDTGARISDRGASIEAGPGCESIERHVVECGLPTEARPHYPNYFNHMFVNLGDLSDTIRFGPRSRGDTHARVYVDGGRDADTLYTGDNAGVGGGPGDDHLIAGEGDLSTSMSGGPGADRLTGGERSDSLVGGPGPDRLRGGGGDDYLYGDYSDRPIAPAGAQDFLDAGDGDDWLQGGQALNALVCGRGRDTTLVERARDLVPLGCESVAFMVDSEFRIWFTVAPHPFAWRGTSVLFRIPCARLELPWGYEDPVPCRGSMVLREATGQRRVLGQGAVPERVASVALNQLGARLARRPDGVAATITLRGHAIGPPNGWTIRLRAPS